MAQLSALLTILYDACHTIEEEYSKTLKPLPSLNDVEPHLLDSQVYPPELRKAVRDIEAAAAQLVVTVGRPDQVILNVCQVQPF